MSRQNCTITLPLPLGLGTVNCYLVQAGAGFILIDTGAPGSRGRLRKHLAQAGCRPGILRLIVITHGDYDHTGGAACLRQEYGAPIAMHPADRAMAEQGDMFAGRKAPNNLIRGLAPLVMGFRRRDFFAPDVLLADGDTLDSYGWQASILSLPGHSRGSIGVLCGAELYCGDLLDNTRQPERFSIMDDVPAADASIRRLREMGVAAVYPGHGRPFQLSQVRE